MKRLIFLLILSLSFLACATGDRQWNGKGPALAQGIPMLAESLENRLRQFDLLSRINSVAPAYALTTPELAQHIIWKTPYQLRVFQGSAGSGYGIVFGPQPNCPQSGAVKCDLGIWSARLSDSLINRQASSEIPLVGGVKGYLDAGGIWWRTGKTNHDLVLTGMTRVQLVTFVNAALTGDRMMNTHTLSLAGKIGTAEVSSVVLRQVGTEFWGSYAYRKVGSPNARLYLYGSVRNGLITLTEYDLTSTRYKPITGTFSGDFQNNGNFVGQWISSSGKKSTFRFTPVQ